MDYGTSIREIKGIGEKTQKLFQKLDIFTVGDLIAHYPVDYEVFGEPVEIAQALPGKRVAVYGAVTAAPLSKTVRRLTITTVTVRDATGSLQLTFFNMPFLSKTLKAGMRYIFLGTIQDKGKAPVMEQPRMFTPEEYFGRMGVLQPKYALTKGLTNQMVQKAMKRALDNCDFAQEYYPPDVLSQMAFPSEREAYQGLHFPNSREQMLAARRRLVFDEFFGFLLLLQQNKESTAALPNHFPMVETADTVRFLEQLPFRLTRGQKKVWQEIRDDLAGEVCMNRLIQGDVGSGKTIVAVLALLQCAANGFQGALMAPTEVLAVQHYETIQVYIRDYGIAFRPVLLVGSMTAKEKKEAYARIASGEANLVIGTHAVIQEKVVFSNLALVVTDEQHRFGVRQRETLAEKGEVPHVLVMSATPIPRTLAIILYGDLQISVIDELPKGRLPIKNCVVDTGFRRQAYAFIEKEVVSGRQAYVICPKVEAAETESQDMENVVDYTEKLRAVLPPAVCVSYLHGKMKPSEKNRIMEEFANGNIHVLVSTTVIEVGINVQNATVMMVENAERFGLAQLHQLRGRVGRGDHQSYCIFMSSNQKPETMERLSILGKSNDGFLIASEDLKLRGPGDLFGLRQSGAFSFVLGDIYTDAGLLSEAAGAVADILQKDPGLNAEEHRRLRERFCQAGRNTVDFRTI